MAYDEELAGRVRDLLAGVEVDEKKMFGGVAFMVSTHMECGIIRDDLMVRIDPDDRDRALERGATDMAPFSGHRPMRGMVMVPGSVVADDAELALWVDQSVAWARAQPPKRPKPATQSPERPKPARRTATSPVGAPKTARSGTGDQPTSQPSEGPRP